MKHTYKPLGDYLKVGESSIHGQGIFSKREIPMYTILGVSHVEAPESLKGVFPNDLIRTPLGGHINHSCEPNVAMFPVADYWVFIAIKVIHINVELTINYDKTPCGVIICESEYDLKTNSG